MKDPHISKLNSLLVGFKDLPFDGVHIETKIPFLELCRDGDLSPETFKELSGVFKDPISVEATIKPIGSKVDVKGSFEADVYGECDRCLSPVKTHIKGDLSVFLMPESQFSDHDKPQGKVMHKPHQENKKSRHHSGSKAKAITHTEGEHEDVNFGAFDGIDVDLRPLARELLILELPMRNICPPEGKAVRLDGKVEECAKLRELMETKEPLEPVSPLAKALKSKIKR